MKRLHAGARGKTDNRYIGQGHMFPDDRHPPCINDHCMCKLGMLLEFSLFELRRSSCQRYGLWSLRHAPRECIGCCRGN